MSGVFLIIAFIGILTVTIITNVDNLKEISAWQSMVVILSFFITIAIATVTIYYGGNWLVGFITNGFIKNIIFLILVLFVITMMSKGLNKTISKVTKSAIEKEKI